MSHFNVLTQPWIPVIDLNGKRKLLGILDTLEQAHQIKELEDANPTYEYGVFRFLCTFLMDVYRPEDWKVLADIYDEGRFDMEKVQNYIKQCETEGVSFDLFDKETPFLQTKYNEEYDKNLVSIARLNIAMPRGNNHIHFEHRQETEQSLTYAEAARGLCALNLFCTSEAQGYSSTVNSVPPLYFVFQASNLFGSLVYSMLTREEGKEVNYDTPPVVWRNNEEVVPKQKETSTSVLYGMLYPCRRVLLRSEMGGIVKRMYFCQGKNYVGYDSWQDPHVSYCITDKGKSSLKPEIEKEPWRNIATILGKGPTSPVFVNRIIEHKLADEVAVKVYGVATHKKRVAQYLDMQKGHLRMPRLIAENETKRNRIEDIIVAAERMSQELGKCLNDCFQEKKKEEKKKDKNKKKMHNSIFAVQAEFLQQCRDTVLQDLFDEMAAVPENKASECTDKYLDKFGKKCMACFDQAADTLFLTGRELLTRQKMRKKLFNALWLVGRDLERDTKG